MIYLSICTRSGDRPKELEALHNYVSNWPEHLEWLNIKVCTDAKSIYEGHKSNLFYAKDKDICILAHDDVEILSTPEELLTLILKCRYSNTGFVGVAGASNLREDAVWWNSRKFNESRGFVFQGSHNTDMTPNYFGKSGQVVVLDGCMMACTKENLDAISLDKPDYLSSDWDFYDIGLTMKAYMMGLVNYAVPIIIRHVSKGEMREGWEKSRKEFIKEYKAYLPCKLNMEKTNGIPD